VASSFPRSVNVWFNREAGDPLQRLVAALGKLIRRIEPWSGRQRRSTLRRRLRPFPHVAACPRRGCEAPVPAHVRPRETIVTRTITRDDDVAEKHRRNGLRTDHS